MKRGIYFFTIFFYIILRFVFFSEASAQCYRGDQNPYENQGRDEVSLYSTATSNTGVQVSGNTNVIIGLGGYYEGKSSKFFYTINKKNDTNNIKTIGYEKNSF